MKRVAVIGGGISGLSAAFYLQKFAPDISVTLFENSSRVGGVINTITTDDSLLEMGADNFATLIPDALQLVRDANLESELVRPNTSHRLARVVCKGKIQPIPTGFSLMQPTRVSEVLRSPVLSIPGRLRLAMEYFVPARRDESDESLESFAVRRLGREAFERLVEPIVGGIFTAKSDTLSMQAAMPQFVEMEKKFGGLIRGHFAKTAKTHDSSKNASGARYDQFVAPKKGMRWLLEQLAGCLKSGTIRYGSKIDSISRHEKQWLVKIGFDESGSSSPVHSNGQSPTDPGKGDLFDAVLVATPAYVSAQVVQSIDSKLADELRSIPYADSAVVAMKVRKNEINPKHLCFGVVVPQIEKRDVLAVSLTSEKYAGRTPDDQVYMRVFMGGAVRPDLMNNSDEVLKEKAWKDLVDLFGLKTKPVWQQVIRWNAAMPQYLVGHNDRVKRIEAAVANYPGLQIVGNAFHGVGIPQCVRMAKNAATQIAQYLAKA